MPGSIFDIIGPPMIGPSSSHTAGAARMGLVAYGLLHGDVIEASIGLHGSFAATGKGHGTDRAIVAGLLGYAPDDERLPQSLEVAIAQGLMIEFSEVDLGDDKHPNTALLTVRGRESKLKLCASSIGGGSIQVIGIDGHAVQFSGGMDTLVVWHTDRPGFLSQLTAIFGLLHVNIATLTTSRPQRGTEVLTVMELDAPVLPEASALLRKVKDVRKSAYLPPLP